MFAYISIQYNRRLFRDTRRDIRSRNNTSQNAIERDSNEGTGNRETGKRRDRGRRGDTVTRALFGGARAALHDSGR